jgi:phage gpG-like protein
MGLTGDFDKLTALVQRLQSLGPAKAALLKQLAEEAHTQVSEGFAAGRAPDGSSWAPLQSRAGQPLLDTGRLRSSITYAIMESGFSLGTAVVYAPVHQFGATIRPKNGGLLRWQTGGRWSSARQVTVPARPFFPEGRVSQQWADDLRAVALEWMRDHLKGSP